MTIINNIEVDRIRPHNNTIKQAILNNDPIEDKLHVIAVVSNPCFFAKRYILMKEFIDRINKDETNVILYIVEMVYGNQNFVVTDKKNPRHLQLRTEVPLWHKENMINLGVKYLLPKNYKAFAWIDADVEFDSATWALDTLRILNGSCDIVQLFSHCLDMDQNDGTMNTFSSAGFQHCKGKPYCNKGLDYWHPGFAWAITRKAYERIGGTYENAILGSGDNIMLFSLINQVLKAVPSQSSQDYKDDMLSYQKKMSSLRLGYVPGLIRHYFHGSKKNRKYQERWQILVKYDYQPHVHITRDEKGVLIPTDVCPDGLKADIFQYFLERNEDEFPVEYKTI